MEIKLKKSILFVLILLLFTSTAQSRKKIIHIATGEFAPFTSESMSNKGLFSEIVTEVFTRMGYEVKYDFMPWSRCEKLVELGQYWGAMPYVKTEERAKKHNFTESVITSHTRFFYYGERKELKNLTVNSFKDIQKYKVGAVKGYYYNKDIEADGVTLYNSYKEEDNLKLLIRGEIDLYPLDEFVAWSLINKKFKDESSNFHMIDFVISNDDLRLLVSKKYPGSNTIISSFNSELSKLKKEGYIKKKRKELLTR
jgi:polar amino acid transport system substrate-binding protein